MLLNEPIIDLVDKLHAGDLDPEACVLAAYENISTWQPVTNALVSSIDRSQALLNARTAVARKLPLSGIPFVLKDSYVTTDSITTAGSKVLSDYHGQYQATVYQKLVSAGAVLVGKANMDAWGHGGSSENNDTGPVKNPFDRSRSAGGSSGGCGVAVSTGMCAFAIGEDTGGSIRNPAAWNNLTGLKVSYGRVSRYGCIAYASSFDTVGPMARTAADCALVLHYIAGHDPYDATSSQRSVPVYHRFSKRSKRLKIGIPENLLVYPALDREIKQTVITFSKQLGSLGHQCIPLQLPSLALGLPVYYLIAPAETSSNLARYDGNRFGQDRRHFTQETMRRIMIGTFALSAGYFDAYYRQAQKARTLIIDTYRQAFSQADVLLMPTTPTHPTRLGELTKDPVTNMLIDMFTVTQNIAGITSLSLPAGFSRTGLPIGVQLTAPMFAEAIILNLAHQYQKDHVFHLTQPIL